MKEKLILQKGTYYFRIKSILSTLEVKLEEALVEEIVYFSADFSSVNDNIQIRRIAFIDLILKNKKLNDEEKRKIIREDVAVLSKDIDDLKGKYFTLRQRLEDKGTYLL
jgi:hypothetical protein